MVQDRIGAEDNYQWIADSEGYRLRLVSTKLKSGKCQVKFYASVPRRKDLYGYLLVDREETLKIVVKEIIDRLKIVQRTSDFKHINLFSLRRSTNNMNNMLIFESQQ